MKQPATIVMSGTITPHSAMWGTVRNDPELRRSEYLEAFKFYLSMPDSLVDHVAMFENSDSDLSGFAEAAREMGSSKTISLIHTPSDYDATRGKGYGEFLMMDHGMDRLAPLDPDRKIWKVTGRLRVVNLARLIESAPQDYDFYCDMRDVPLIGERFGGNKWMDLRVFSYTPAAYDRHIRGCYENAHVVLEKELFEIVTRARATGTAKVVPRFRQQPRLAGFGGLANTNYAGPAHRLKDGVRSVARKVLPGLWL